MTGHRTAECVLRIGVDVHLHHAVAHGLRDLLRRGAGTAVEHQGERLTGSDIQRVRGVGHFAGLNRERDRGLDFVEQFGAQFHHARFVCAVHVAEGEGGHVASALAEAESLRDGDALRGRGIQFVIDFGAVPVFFATDRADFDFQHGVRGLGFVEQFFCDVEVFIQRHCGTVPHV